MADADFAIAGIELDELGRVVLSDQMLDMTVACTDITSAGANMSCPGSANPTSCSNSTCGYSQNGGYCNNGSSCGGAWNTGVCV